MEPPSSQVAILQKISSIVSSQRSLDEMLGEIIGLTVQVTDCDACLVYLFDRDTNEIVLQASQVPHASELLNTDRLLPCLQTHLKTHVLSASLFWWKILMRPSCPSLLFRVAS